MKASAEICLLQRYAADLYEEARMYFEWNRPASAIRLQMRAAAASLRARNALDNHIRMMNIRQYRRREMRE